VPSFDALCIRKSECLISKGNKCRPSRATQNCKLPGDAKKRHEAETISLRAVVVPQNFDNDYRLRRGYHIVILDRRLPLSSREVIIESFSFSLLTPFVREFSVRFGFSEVTGLSSFSGFADSASIASIVDAAPLT
jgi:hypothetical protein